MPGRIAGAVDRRRFCRCHLDQHKGRTIALTKHLSSFGQFSLFGYRTHVRDAATFGHLRNIDAAPSMAFLPASLAVMLVIDADDRQVWRIKHANRRQGAYIHQQLTITGHNHNLPVGLSQRKA